MSQRDAMKGISRMDYPKTGTHGWLVRVRKEAYQKSKFFSDRTWGGKWKSLAKSKRWRDAAQRTLDRTNDPKKLKMFTVRKGWGNTAVTGVHANLHENSFLVTYGGSGSKKRTQATFHYIPSNVATVFMEAVAFRKSLEHASV